MVRLWFMQPGGDPRVGGAVSVVGTVDGGYSIGRVELRGCSFQGNVAQVGGAGMEGLRTWRCPW